MAVGIYDGKSVKGPLDSGDGSKTSFVGKTGWPSWAGKKVLSTDGFSFNLDDRDMDDSESDGYLVDPKGGICHLSMQNIGGSNIDSNMYFMFDLKTVLKLNSKFKINGLRGVPKNPKELFLLAQLCQVVHYSIQVGETAEKGSRDKAAYAYYKYLWNKQLTQKRFSRELYWFDHTILSNYKGVAIHLACFDIWHVFTHGMNINTPLDAMRSKDVKNQKVIMLHLIYKTIT